MEKGFYTWYEDVFNRCAEQGGIYPDNASERISGQLVTSMFSGKFSSPMVVVRMGKAYDFKFPGAWPRSFKAFLYRQQNYHQILHDLYSDYLDPMLLREHRNLVSFIEGQPVKERANVNKVLGNKLDMLFRVVLPDRSDTIASLNVNDILRGVFLWQRTYMLILGDDTLRNMENEGVQVKLVREGEFPFGTGSIVFKVAQISCMGERRFVPVLPDFAELNVLPEQLCLLREQVNLVLSELEITYASARLTKQLLKN